MKTFRLTHLFSTHLQNGFFGRPLRTVCHLHVSVALCKLIEHLGEPSLSRRLELRADDPADVIVLLVRRTFPIGCYELVLDERGPDEGGHLVARSFEA